jgi:glycosyltransferase involved in cell wall biosynthesis
MKVLIISQNFYPEIGSHANRITNVSTLLASQGHSVDVLTSDPSYPNRELYTSSHYWDERKEEIEDSGVNIIRLPSPVKERGQSKIKRLYYYLSFFFKTISYVMKSHIRYDLVFVTSPQLFIGLTGILAKLKWKAKFIFDVRDLWPESVKHVGLYRKNDIALKLAYSLEKKILDKANAVIVNSKGFLSYMKEKNVDKKSYYLPNAVRREELIENIGYRAKSLSEEYFSIVYAGNIGLAQDLRVLVKLARKLKDYKNIRFTIIGTGVQEEKVREKARKYGLDNIVFKGVLPRKETLREIGKHHIAFLNLKNEEVFKTVIPGKLIDYMSLGMPIIAGVDGEARRVLEEAQCGFVCNPGDYNSMADSIVRLMKNRGELESTGTNGYSYINKHFVWEKNILNFGEILQDLETDMQKFRQVNQVDIDVVSQNNNL